MPRVITETHQWVVAANIDVTDKQARWAAHRGTLQLSSPLKVEALDVICVMCRQLWDKVSDQPCEAAIDNRHLHGGDPHGKRKPRGLVVERPRAAVAE